jgi:hypothetical protein
MVITMASTPSENASRRLVVMARAESIEPFRAAARRDGRCRYLGQSDHRLDAR